MVKEYIERNALLTEIISELEYDPDIYTSEHNRYVDFGLKIAIRDVKAQPVVDVVEVVRCKDCKHRSQLTGKAPFAFYACSYDKGLGDNVREDDFCSYGERKE